MLFHLQLALVLFGICLSAISCTATNTSSSLNRETVQIDSPSNDITPQSLNCDAAAKEVMGQLFNGIESQESVEKAIESCMRTAQEGDSDSQYYLSILYMVKNNRKESQESYKWTLIAAKNGHPQAQYHLGTMYEAGNIVKHDIEDANYWYLLAAESGFVPAQLKLGHNYTNGLPGGADFSRKTTCTCENIYEV